MKIAVRDINAFLSKPSGGAALLYGPDTGLARERSQAITKKLLGEKPDALSILDITEAKLVADPALLADELSSVSLLADKRVILIRDAGDKLTKILESAADLLKQDVYVIVLAEELGPRSSLRAWFEKAPNTAAIACYHDEARDIGEVIRESFREGGITAEGEVVPYLVSQLGNDRYVTRQELAKLITYAGEEKRLSLADAKALTDYNRETELDEAINALADKNLAGFDKALTQLIKEGTQPIQYLRGLSRYFQRLYAIKLQAKDSSVEQVIASLRPPVFFRQVPILTRHAKSWNIDAIAKALALINEAELAVKSSDVPIIAASERVLFRLASQR